MPTLSPPLWAVNNHFLCRDNVIAIGSNRRRGWGFARLMRLSACH